jgi:hypothetical protein
VHAVGVAVDVAWQRTQQSLMQQRENCVFYGVCSEATIADFSPTVSHWPQSGCWESRGEAIGELGLRGERDRVESTRVIVDGESYIEENHWIILLRNDEK